MLCCLSMGFAFTSFHLCPPLTQLLVNYVAHYSWLLSRVVGLEGADFNLVTVEQWAPSGGSSSGGSPDDVLKPSGCSVSPLLFTFAEDAVVTDFRGTSETTLPVKVEVCLFKAITRSCAVETGPWRDVEVSHLMECHHSQPAEFVNVNRSRCPICSSAKHDEDQQPTQCRKCQGDLHIWTEAYIQIFTYLPRVGIHHKYVVFFHLGKYKRNSGTACNGLILEPLNFSVMLACWPKALGPKITAICFNLGKMEITQNSFIFQSVIIDVACDFKLNGSKMKASDIQCGWTAITSGWGVILWEKILEC